MTTLNGLPAHILLVHAIVVLLPLAAGLLVLCAARPAARARFAGANALLALGTLALVPVTTNAGEWLQARVKDTQVVRDHASIGGTAALVAIPVAVLAVLVWWRSREAQLAARPGGVAPSPGGDVRPSAGSTLVAAPVSTTTATAPPRRAYLAPASVLVTRIVLALSILAAAAAVVDIYEIGDSGARAAWEHGFSSAPQPGR